MWTFCWLLQRWQIFIDVLALLSVIHTLSQSSWLDISAEKCQSWTVIHLQTCAFGHRLGDKSSSFQSLAPLTGPRVDILCFSRVNHVMAKHAQRRNRQPNVSDIERMQHSTVHLPASSFQACRPRSRQSGVTNALAHVRCSRQSMNLVHVSVAFALVVVNHRSL